MTRNRIRSVSVEMLTPPSPLNYTTGSDVRGPRAIEEHVCSLPMVVCAVPCAQEEEQGGVTGTAIIGQSTTVIHPDLRQPWVKVGHWNWMEMFSNVQLQPHYANYVSGTPPNKGLELFRLTMLDSVSGAKLAQQKAGERLILNFRVCIELSAPIGLIPQPRRFYGGYDEIAGSGSINDPEEDITPVQYKLQGIQNLF